MLYRIKYIQFMHKGIFTGRIVLCNTNFMVIIMTKVIRARTMDRAPIRLRDFDANCNIAKAAIATQVVSIDFQDNEATRRMVMHSAKRVISQHKAEIQELAYK